MVGHGLFDEITSLANLFAAWYEFKQGKTGKADVLRFELNLEDNLYELHQELKDKTYRHSNYTSFSICDPKLRHIHKATVRDRIVHHALFRKLYPIFDKQFIYASYSCRINKGTHRAVRRLKAFCRKLSKNYRHRIYYLKCDIKRFFDSVHHSGLRQIIERRVNDPDTLWLLDQIIGSFQKDKGRGIPLGNVTSQLFCNIYLNQLDQFVKHSLTVKYYIRYCDDLVLLDENRDILEEYVPKIQDFLRKDLKLKLHPGKIIIRKLKQGIDFLGYVVLPHHTVMRTKTKKRMFKKLKQKRKALDAGLISRESYQQSVKSYLGMLKHSNGHRLESRIREEFFID